MGPRAQDGVHAGRLNWLTDETAVEFSGLHGSASSPIKPAGHAAGSTRSVHGVFEYQGTAKR